MKTENSHSDTETVIQTEKNHRNIDKRCNKQRARETYKTDMQRSRDVTERQIKKKTKRDPKRDIQRQ